MFVALCSECQSKCSCMNYCSKCGMMAKPGSKELDNQELIKYTWCETCIADEKLNIVCCSNCKKSINQTIPLRNPKIEKNKTSITKIVMIILLVIVAFLIYADSDNYLY